MVDVASWDLLEARCTHFMQNADEMEILSLLTSLESAAVHAGDDFAKIRLAAAIAATCEKLREKWNESGDIIYPYQLRTYCRVSIAVVPLPPLPNIVPSWNFHMDVFREAITEADDEGQLDINSITRWIYFIDVLADNEPRFLRQVDFPAGFKDDIDQLIKVIEDELDSSSRGHHYDRLKKMADYFESIASTLDTLSGIISIQRKTISELSKRAQWEADELSDKAAEMKGEEPDDVYEPVEHSKDDFDVVALFADL